MHFFPQKSLTISIEFSRQRRRWEYSRSCAGMAVVLGPLSNMKETLKLPLLLPTSSSASSSKLLSPPIPLVAFSLRFLLSPLPPPYARYKSLLLDRAYIFLNLESLCENRSYLVSSLSWFPVIPCGYSMINVCLNWISDEWFIHSNYSQMN